MISYLLNPIVDRIRADELNSRRCALFVLLNVLLYMCVVVKPPLSGGSGGVVLSPSAACGQRLNFE